MTWSDHHRKSEALASEAYVAKQAGFLDQAELLYVQAAHQEESALAFVNEAKPRTYGITAVSAVSLYVKGRELSRAEQLAHRILADGSLPGFAADEVRLLLQGIWTEKSKAGARVSFLPGQVFVSIAGGEVVTGGAPLDLIVEKVQTVQAIFYRTIELLRGLPHRQRGGPSRLIQESCRPWLFQAPPGSYQFSVAVQEPRQQDFFRPDVKPQDVAETFMEILRASSSGDAEDLVRVVPDEAYRPTFLKLTRNLAPTGRTYERMQISAAAHRDGSSVVLSPENRQSLNRALKVPEVTDALIGRAAVDLKGILRAVHLDKDWLDLMVDGATVHVEGVRDTIDDLIGPMVNKLVVVRAMKEPRGRLVFRDIELDE